MSRPDLATPVPLAPAAIDSFRNDGHVLLEGVCAPEEVAAFRPVIGNAARRLSPERPAADARDTFERAFFLAAGLWNRDPDVDRFTRAPRFARIAAALMGVPAVRLYHDVALFKEPGDDYTPWHQDQYYWPMATPHTVTMWMPLVDVREEMGALTFASGSHREGDLGAHAISDDTHDHFAALIRDRGWPVVRRAMRAGDATFHSGWTLHGAPPNRSQHPREVITVVFYADGTRTWPERGNAHRGWDWDHFMPGVAPGAVAASPLNPRVWPV